MYSFLLTEGAADPDLKLYVEADDSDGAAARRAPPRFYAAAQVDDDQARVPRTRRGGRPRRPTEAAAEDAVHDAHRGHFARRYPTTLGLPVRHQGRTRSPSTSTAIFHDDRFTYIHADAAELPVALRGRGRHAPNLVNFQVEHGIYIVLEGARSRLSRDRRARSSRSSGRSRGGPPWRPEPTGPPPPCSARPRSTESRRAASCRDSVQMWLMAGLAVVIVLIILIAGPSATAGDLPSGTSARSPPTLPDADRIRAYQQQLAEDEARLRQVQKEAMTPPRPPSDGAAPQAPRTDGGDPVRTRLVVATTRVCSPTTSRSAVGLRSNVCRQQPARGHTADRRRAGRRATAGAGARRVGTTVGRRSCCAGRRRDRRERRTPAPAGRVTG